MKDKKVILRKITAFMVVFLLVISSVLFIPLRHVHASDLSALTDQLTDEELEYFYDNFPDVINGAASSDPDYGISTLDMAAEYSIVPQISQNPGFYLYPGQTVEFPIIYGIHGSTVVTPGVNQFMFFQLQINLPSVSGVTFYVDSAHASYLGVDYPVSYTNFNNYYFVVPPVSGISNTYGGPLAFEFRIKAVYNKSTSQSTLSSTGYTVHEESIVKNFSVTNNHSTSAYSTLSFHGSINVGAVTGTLTQSSYKNFVHYSTSGQITDFQMYPSDTTVRMNPYSVSLTNVSIDNPVYGLVWNVPSFKFLLGRDDHLFTTVDTQNGLYVPPTTFNVISKVQWFPKGQANDVLTAIKENTAAVKDTTAWVKENYVQVVRTNDILTQVNKLQQTNNQQQSQQTQAIKDQTTTITNQTDNMMNGYDNSGLGNTNDKLSGSVAQYDQAENNITSSAVAGMNAFIFDDYLSFAAGTSSAMTFVGSFINSCANASGDFFSVVMIWLCMMFITILIGIWRFRGG